MSLMIRAFKRYGRAALLGGSVMLSGTMLGCASDEEECGDCAGAAHGYVLTVVTTSSDIVGLYVWGVPVGTFAPFAVGHIVAPVDDPSSPPNTVTVGFSASPAMQGSGIVSYEMPRTSEVGGVMIIGNEGLSWLHFENPVNDTILHLTLIDANGDEAQPFQAGQSGQLIYPLEPGAEMFLVGLPTSDYKKLRFQTAKGLLVELDL